MSDPTEPLTVELTPLQSMRIERNAARRMALKLEFESKLAAVEGDDKALESELASQWGITADQLSASQIEFNLLALKARVFLPVAE